MICIQCESEHHLICGLNLNCACCQKTLREMWEDDTVAYKLLLKRIKGKENAKTKTKTHGRSPRQSKS